MLLADRAKSIRTHAKVNESETDRLIKELLSEKERLLKELENSKHKVVIGMSDEQVEELKHNYEDQIERYWSYPPSILSLLLLFISYCCYEINLWRYGII